MAAGSDPGVRARNGFTISRADEPYARAVRSRHGRTGRDDITRRQRYANGKIR